MIARPRRLRRPSTAPRPARRPTAHAAALLAATLLGAGCGGASSAAAPPTPLPPPVVRAAAGDTLYVIEHAIRADRRDRFERFLQESYWPALQRVARTDSNAARVLRSTRVLYPTRPNADGSYSYLFLMDPVVRGETYAIPELLGRVWPPAETARRYRELTESWASRGQPWVARPFVQPPYPSTAPGDSAAAPAAESPSAAP